jgi:hypothetical protein
MQLISLVVLAFISISTHAQIIKTEGVRLDPSQLPRDGKEQEVILRYEGGDLILTGNFTYEGNADSFSNSVAKFNYKRQLKGQAKWDARQMAASAMERACEQELKGRLKTDGRIYRHEKQDIEARTEQPVCEAGAVHFVARASLKASAVCVVNPRWLPAHLRVASQ